MVENVPKRNAFVKLSFLVSTSFQIRKKLQQFFTDKLTSFNFKIVYSSSFEYFSILTRESNFFKMKIMESLPIASVSQLLAKRIPRWL